MQEYYMAFSSPSDRATTWNLGCDDGFSM